MVQLTKNASKCEPKKFYEIDHFVLKDVILDVKRTSLLLKIKMHKLYYLYVGQGDKNEVCEKNHFIC
jgi:hypothetical protein